MKNIKDVILKELIEKQLKDVQTSKKFRYGDIKRISKYITSSIFKEDECCLWNGYITNLNNKNKGTYVNFYFNGKKTALHRLLYINYIESLEENEYLKFSCPNKGKCCNVKHMSRLAEERHPVPIGEVSNKTKNKEVIEHCDSNTSVNDGNFIVSFE